MSDTPEDKNAENKLDQSPSPQDGTEYLTRTQVHLIVAMLLIALALCFACGIALLALRKPSSVSSLRPADIAALAGTWRASNGLLISFDKTGLAAIHRQDSYEMEHWYWKLDTSCQPPGLSLAALNPELFLPRQLYTSVRFDGPSQMQMAAPSLTHWPMRVDGGGSLSWSKISGTSPEYYTQVQPHSEAFLNRFIPSYPGAKLSKNQYGFMGGLAWNFEVSASPEQVTAFYNIAAQKKGWQVKAEKSHFVRVANILTLSRGKDQISILMDERNGILSLTYWLDKSHHTASGRL